MEEKEFGIFTVGQGSRREVEEVGSDARGKRDEEYPEGCEKE